MSDEDIRRFGRELERSGRDPVDVALGLVRAYRLYHGDYDRSDEWWFISTEDMSKEAFRALTNSLLPEASERAIAEARREGGYLSWVGWNDIVKEMVPLLEARGFKRLRPVSSDYSGPGIIENEDRATSDDASVPGSVIEHNRLAREQHAERMEAFRRRQEEERARAIASGCSSDCGCLCHWARERLDEFVAAHPDLAGNVACPYREDGECQCRCHGAPAPAGTSA